MKATIAKILLWLAVLWWAAWFGGQLFNALMVVPYYSSAPPQSLREFGKFRWGYHLADFFVLFNSLWIFLALALSLIFGWKIYPNARKPLIVSMIAALISAVLVLLWMAPTISRVVTPDNSGLSLSQIEMILHEWTIANWIRLGIELIGFIFAVIALNNSKIQPKHNLQ